MITPSFKKYLSIVFSILVIGILFLFVEWGAYYYMTHNQDMYSKDLRLGMRGDFEHHDYLGYHIRRDTFKNPFGYQFYYKKIKLRKKNAEYSQSSKAKREIGKISFNFLEGYLRHVRGDSVINKWGYLGPYFEENPNSHTFRIITLGGSTTAGEDSVSEVSYPQLLERMLNQVASKDRHYEVLNFGHWGYNFCQIKYLLKHDVMRFKPDMILVMSGLNDAFKLTRSFEDKEAYCELPLQKRVFNFLSRSHFFRGSRLLLHSILKGARANSDSDKEPVDYKIKKRNIGFFYDHLMDIVHQTQKLDVQLGLISLPTVIERDIQVQDLKSYPQLLEPWGYVQNIQDTVAEINRRYRKAAGESPHTFYIDSGVSLNSNGKKRYFTDPIHFTGSGNRILAFGIFKRLRERLELTDYGDPNLNEFSLNGKQIEIEFLKGIFAASRIEDLSYSGCVSLYEYCMYVGPKINGIGYVTSTVEFTLGSVLQYYDEVVKDIEYGDMLIQLLLKGISKEPEFGPAHWVLAQIYRLKNKNELANQHLVKAHALNSYLKDLDFQKEVLKFQKHFSPNELAPSGKTLIEFYKKGSNDIVPYLLFRKLVQAKSAGKTVKEILNLYFNIYYSCPLLFNSVFEAAINYLIDVGELELAKSLLKSVNKTEPFSKFSFQEALLKEIQ